VAQQNLNRHLKAVWDASIWAAAVLAAAMSSLLNLSHVSKPLEQSQLVKRLLDEFL